MNFSTVVTLIYRVLANLGTITTLYNKLSPFIPQITELWNVLQGKSTSQYDVSWLQASLNKLGANPKLAVDGNYGELTKAAVSAYQQKAGITVDGWAGVETIAALLRDLSK